MSFRFEELVALEPGEIYWENSQYGSVRFTIKERPHVTSTLIDSTMRKQVWFTGYTDEGEEIPYMVTEGLENYGPDISTYKTYERLEDLRNIYKGEQDDRDTWLQKTRRA